jgi:hypothetical protein
MKFIKPHWAVWVPLHIMVSSFDPIPKFRYGLRVKLTGGQLRPTPSFLGKHKSVAELLKLLQKSWVLQQIQTCVMAIMWIFMGSSFVKPVFLTYHCV